MWPFDKIQKVASCEQCGVYFTPRGEDDMWPHLCLTHRAPEATLWGRKQAVLRWAEVNWERLSKQMLEEHQKATVDLDAQHDAYLNDQLRAQQQARQYTDSRGFTYGLGNMQGFRNFY